MKRAVLILCLAAAARLCSADLLEGVAEPDQLTGPAGEVAKALGRGGVDLGLPKGALPLRGEGGAWRPAALGAALASQGPLEAAGAELAPGKLRAQGLPKILVLENSSTVSPWSPALARWGWPHQKAAFQEVEAAPGVWLDPERFDLAVFTSPGWWQDFANPPGGPSRLPEAVARALARFVEHGSSAIFLDVAQWDLEKAWPKSLRLASLGPYQVSRLKAAPEGKEGALALAPVGVAPEALLRSGAQALFQHPRFDYPDGEARPIQAAYALPLGKGWALGLAFHPFEQDDSHALRAQRLVLNALVLAGLRRLSAKGEAAPTPPEAAPTATETAPTATESPTPPQPAAPPTALPATPRPSASPTPRPSPSATATATPLPIRTPRPTSPPTPRPTHTRTFAAPRPSATRTEAPRPKPSATRSATPKAASPTRTITAWVIPGLPPLPSATPSPRATPRPPAGARPHPRPTPPGDPTPKPSPPATQAPRPGPPPPKRTGPQALGCLSSAPEPFAEGGTYIYYCLKQAAGLRLSVYSPDGGLVWRGEEAWSKAGQGQLFFEGRDARGRELAPGQYFFQLEARYGPEGRLGAESRQGAFTRARSRARR